MNQSYETWKSKLKNIGLLHYYSSIQNCNTFRIASGRLPDPGRRTSPKNWVTALLRGLWNGCMQTLVYVGTGGSCPPPQLRPCPQMWHEAMFDELKASAYRCKRSVLWPSQYAEMRFRPGLCPGPAVGAHDASRPLVGWEGHPSHTLPHSALDSPAFGACHSASRYLGALPRDIIL